MSKTSLVLFILILAVAAVLRLYAITHIPPGINQDEGSIGYTAYSLLKTGKDEYGRAFPLSFQSFGDWKLPLYIYVTVPFVALLGMTELAVRLPSAIAGIITVGLTYFLVKELFSSRKEGIQTDVLAFITMTLIAIAPWHLHLSRVESESNTAVMFMTAGLLLFLKAVKGREWFFLPSGIMFVLSYYTYAGNHVFTTLLLCVLAILYIKKIPRTTPIFIAAGVFLILFSIIFYFTFFEASKTKLSGISIFGDPSVVHSKIEIPRNEHASPQSLSAKLSHNKIVYAGERFVQNYLNAFSPDFLFINGGKNRAHNIQNFGNMYLVESFFLFAGIVYFITKKKTKETIIILSWILLAPVAASITKDAPHTNRMFAIFPMLPLVTAMGLYVCITYLPKKLRGIPLRTIGVGGVALLFLINVALYLDRYYVHFPRNEAEHWGKGYTLLSEVLTDKEHEHKKVIMTHPEYSHYIYLLFYQKYDPALYQKQAVRYPPTEDGFVHVKSFGRYEFRDIDWEKDMAQSDTILIGFPKEVPEDAAQSAAKTSQIVLDDQEPMFTVVETK